MNVLLFENKIQKKYRLKTSSEFFVSVKVSSMYIQTAWFLAADIQKYYTVEKYQILNILQMINCGKYYYVWKVEPK